MPGSNADPSLRDRVTNLTGLTDGLFEVTDVSSNPAGGPEDRLSVALVSLAQPIAPGPFARIRFECASDAGAPAAADLDCTIQASRFVDGSLISPASCEVTNLVTTP
jgi:hypothetical protein